MGIELEILVSDWYSIIEDPSEPGRFWWPRFWFRRNLPSEPWSYKKWWKFVIDLTFMPQKQRYFQNFTNKLCVVRTFFRTFIRNFFLKPLSEPFKWEVGPKTHKKFQKNESKSIRQNLIWSEPEVGTGRFWFRQVGRFGCTLEI